MLEVAGRGCKRPAVAKPRPPSSIAEETRRRRLIGVNAAAHCQAEHPYRLNPLQDLTHA